MVRWFIIILISVYIKHRKDEQENVMVIKSIINSKEK